MKKIVWVLLVILLALALRFWGLGNIDKIYFDEVLYLYEALKYHAGVLPLARECVEVPKHPMLSTAFMQLGIAIFGFNYLGWRIFSVVAGSLSVLALFLLARELFSFRAALLAGFLLSINFLHLVLSRVAMVDIYLLCFVLFGFYFLARSLPKKDSRYLLLSGTFFGLGLATKWVALLSLLSAILIYLLRSRDPKKWRRGLAQLVLLPPALYFLVSLYFHLSAGMDLLAWIQFEISNLQHHRAYTYIHPHVASAWSWPFLLKSTPFHSSDAGREMVRVVIAFGNPAIYWVMVPVLGYLIYEFWKKRNPSLIFVFIGFFGFYLPWLAFEFFKARGVFFYYFLPAIPFYLMGLSHILDECLEGKAGKIAAFLYLALVAGLFIYFSPLLFGFPISPNHFYRLIWIKGWI
jgi:dolichyl-phosphate-mannose-protein mannosyltransferase